MDGPDLKGVSKDIKDRVSSYLEQKKADADAYFAKRRAQIAAKTGKTESLMEAVEVAAGSVAGSLGGASAQAVLTNRNSRIAPYADLGLGAIAITAAIMGEKQLGKSGMRIMLGFGAGSAGFGLGRLAQKHLLKTASAEGETKVAGVDEEELENAA